MHFADCRCFEHLHETYEVQRVVGFLITIQTHIAASYTVMRRLTTGIPSEKCLFRRFRSCADAIECTYTNLDSIVYYSHASLNDGDTF